jgi:hypothetical protein
MAVKRIQDIQIKKRGLLTAVYGNITDTFIDNDLKKYTFNQQLYLYLKDEGFQIIIFYDREHGVFSYEEESLNRFLSNNASNKNNNENSKSSESVNDGRPLGKRRLLKNPNTSSHSHNNSSADDRITFRTGYTDAIGFWQIKNIEDSALVPEFTRIISERRFKTALIFNVPNINFNASTEFITSLSTAIRNSTTDGNPNKLLINYGMAETKHFIEYFQQYDELFADEFLKGFFLEPDGGTDKCKEATVFEVKFPDKEECVNLINRCRLIDTKQVEWSDFDVITEMLVAENRSCKSSLDMLKDHVSKLSMAELIKINFVKSKKITLDIDKMKHALNQIKGQKDNIDIIIDEIRRWSEDEQRKKPLTFFAAGPSGTGKTLTAEILTEVLQANGFGYSFFDMNEYKDESSFSKLIGSAPGFVGSTETPKLFEVIKKSRRLVILFDEIEKAYPEILTLLMQMIDKGKLSNNNHEGDFKECILFFTSNAGQNELIEKKRNTIRTKGNDIDVLTDIEFSSEIREILRTRSGNDRSEVWNRFNVFLIYNPLDYKDIIEIAIDNIRKQATEKALKINQISPHYLAYLAKKYVNRSIRQMVEEIKRSIYKLK